MLDVQVLIATPHRRVDVLAEPDRRSTRLCGTNGAAARRAFAGTVARDRVRSRGGPLVAGRQTRAGPGWTAGHRSAFIASVCGRGLEAGPADDHWRVNRAQQLYFAERVETPQGAAADARKCGAIAPARAKKLTAHLGAVATEVPRLVRQQGFIGAVERASYARTLKEA